MQYWQVQREDGSSVADFASERDAYNAAAALTIDLQERYFVRVMGWSENNDS